MCDNPYIGALLLSYSQKSWYLQWVDILCRFFVTTLIQANSIEKIIIAEFERQV